MNYSQITQSVIETIQQLCEKQHEVVIGLSGGRSLDGWYKDFLQKTDTLTTKQWKKIRFCLLDERIVPFESPDSNYLAIYHKFFKELVAKKCVLEKQFIKIDPYNRLPARHYNKKIEKIDIGLFGVGEDGHIASLFSHHELLNNIKKYYLEIKDSPKPPSHRITISPRMIGDMSLVVGFFIGASKQDAYNNFHDTSLDESECPAKLLNEAKQTLIIQEK